VLAAWYGVTEERAQEERIITVSKKIINDFIARLLKLI
jgi:hypothetical protein